jgi:hypothetical protein
MARLTGEDFNSIFESFERTAFRLETLPHYAVPIEAEAFADFLAGRPFNIDWHRPWLDTMAGHIQAGRTVQRVRVMDEPPTPYQRFELAVTPHNLAIGEDIRVLRMSAARALNLPELDFWLFDDARIVVMQFDAGGVLLDAEVSDDAARVAIHREARDRALAHAVPYVEYMAVHPGGEDV